MTALAREKPAPDASRNLPWRCFLCDEVFTDEKAAALHFGTSIMQSPACQIDAKWLRYLERQLERYREEDTDLHRHIAGLKSQSQVAVMRAEEEGYASGLRDAAKLGRKYFETAGKLYPCPNPPHEFELGRIIGQWRWAKDSWGDTNNSGNLVTTWLGISKIENPDGLCLVSVVIWKLLFMFGLKVGASSERGQ